MSTESQAEQIWQYAMHGYLPNGKAKDASVNGIGIVDVSMEEDSMDFSDGLSFPSKLDFYGLADSTTQSVSQQRIQEMGAESFGSQGDSDAAVLTHASPTLTTEAPQRQKTYPEVAIKHASGGDGGGGGTEPVSGGHVTGHVMNAPSHAPTSIVSPIKGSATNPVPSTEGAVTSILSGPLNKWNKAISFDAVSLPPQSPQTLLRNHTMPPLRLNRYAPRDIDRSSQDSFADPVSQDLASYVKNARPPLVKPTRGGTAKPATPVLPSRVSESPSSEAPLREKIVNVSESFTEADDSTESRGLHPSHLPVRSNSPSQGEPIILVKDTQSQSHDSDRSEMSEKSVDVELDHQAGDDVGGDGGGLYQYSHGDLSPTASLASSSFILEQNPPVPTQTQSSQAPSQTSLLLYQPEAVHPAPMLSMQQSMKTDISAPSPFPIPPYRQKEIQIWQRAQQRGAGDEVVPETPASTVVRSLPGSKIPVQPQFRAVSNLDIEQTQTQIQDQADAPPESPNRASTARHKRPSSKDKGKGEEDAPSVKSSPARPLRLTMRSNKLDSSHRYSERVSPTPSREGPSSIPDKVPLGVPSRPLDESPPRVLPSDFVPDSQEDQQQGQHAPISAATSSPSIPLREVPRDEPSLRPPTPTPAGVKSTLRRGELPAGVTHTRGRGRPSSAKGKEKEGKRQPQLAPQPERALHEVSELSEVETEMDIKKEGNLAVQPVIEPVEEKLRAAPRSTRRKRSTTEAKKGKPIVKKETRPRRAATAAAKPATRKRKNNLSADSSKESVGTRETSIPLKKRQRSSFNATSEPSDLSIRVFARYDGSGNSKHSVFYLPGTVIVDNAAGDLSSANRFTVRFDDGKQREVEVADMRQFELVLGDIVYVTGDKGTCSKAEVLDIECWATNETVEVHDMERGVDGDDYDVESKLIKVAEGDIYAQWKERCVSTRTLFKDRDFPVPPLNKALAGIGFMVTLPDLPKSKRSLVGVIEASGGVLYSDWSSAVALSGTMEAGGKRMVSKIPEMKTGKDMRKASSPTMIFCLSDEPKTTPKYLIALALGVPCISIEWVLDRATEAQKDSPRYIDWQAYILPAGQNSLTRLPASQAFNRAWWKEDDNHLSKLLLDPPVLKPFAGKKFLCVGPPEFLFPDKEFGTFPKLLLAMGASYVQAVVEITYASLKDVDEFDYTVVDDGYEVVSHRESVATNVSWIKKCLLTGCEGPVPWPDRE